MLTYFLFIAEGIKYIEARQQLDKYFSVDFFILPNIFQNMTVDSTFRLKFVKLVRELPLEIAILRDVMNASHDID
jgi:hypothetical protein